jgi:putative transposase
LLKREGWPVGKKLVYRLYRELGLQMRTKKRRKLASAQCAPAHAATKRNEKWSMDFVADRLEGGRPFRVLTVIDQFTRECLKLSRWITARSFAREQSMAGPIANE